MPARIIKRHDTQVTPRVRFLDEDGDPIDLTDCTITYSLRNVLTLLLKVNRAAALAEDQLLHPGQAFYQFLAADVDTVGVYIEQWELVYPSTQKETFPVGIEQYVHIEEDIDNV